MDFHSFKKILIYSNSMGLYMIHDIIAIIKIKHTEGNYRKYVIYNYIYIKGKIID